MEFTIDREIFWEGIKKTLGVVEKQNATPILQNLLIRTGGDGIEILATDREIGIKTNYEASVIKVGGLTIPARKLNEIVRELQGETIHLETKGHNIAVITSNKAVCKINGLAEDDFPEITIPEECESFTIAPMLLRAMLRVSYASAGRDDARKNLAGVFLQKIMDGDVLSIRMAATDGHRLAITKAGRNEADLPIPGKGIIIPGKGVAEIRKISENAADDVQICFVQGAIIVIAGRATLRVSLIDGNYPDIQRVIPDETAEGILQITVLREALLHSLRRIAVYGSGIGCVLDIYGGAIHLEASDPDIGEIKDEIEAETPDGAQRVVKFNVHYLSAAIEAVTDEEVVLNVPSGNGGCLVRGSQDKNYFGVVMPLKG